jgi:shikimate kinase
VDPENQAILESAKIPAVFLDASAEELFDRSGQPDVLRPLRMDRDQFCRLYEQRRPAYSNAAICVQTSGKDVGAVAEEIITALKLVPGRGVSE